MAHSRGFHCIITSIFLKRLYWRPNLEQSPPCSQECCSLPASLAFACRAAHHAGRFLALVACGVHARSRREDRHFGIEHSWHTDAEKDIVSAQMFSVRPPFSATSSSSLSLPTR